jgi:hypothetical protein
MDILRKKPFTHDGSEYYSIATIEGGQVRIRVYHDENAEHPADPSSYWFPPDPSETFDFDDEQFRSIAGRGPVDELMNASISGFKTLYSYRNQ